MRAVEAASFTSRDVKLERKNKEIQISLYQRPMNTRRRRRRRRSRRNRRRIRRRLRKRRRRKRVS